jgi:class 3 adenylate cyclase
MAQSNPGRKTLAIVFCDIVSFSALMAEAGDLVAGNVLRIFYEQAGELAKRNRCLTLKFIGDGFLASFESLPDAVELVRLVERLLLEEQTIAAQGLAFKFTLHYADVLVVETSYGVDVLGDEINIAAHLTEPAAAHELVISRTAFDRLPAVLQARAGPSESFALKRGRAVEFRRLDLRSA